MKDRLPTKPGRVLVTPENGGAAFYATLSRADEPRQEGDALNKANLLKDSTAALFGLGADAVPDEAFAFLGKYNQHWWKRRTRTVAPVQVAWADYELGRKTGADTYNTVTYSDSITVSDDLSTITLNNPATVNISYNNRLSVAGRNILGKYVKGLYDDASAVFYVPPGGVISGSSSSTYYHVYVTAFKISAGYIFGEWEYLFADNINAYPSGGFVGGYEYLYIGIPLDSLTSADPVQLAYNSNIGLYNDSSRKSVTINLSDDMRNYSEIVVIGLGAYVYYDGSTGNDISVNIGDSAEMIPVGGLPAKNSYTPITPADCSSYPESIRFKPPIVNEAGSSAWVLSIISDNIIATARASNYTTVDFTKLTFTSTRGITACRVYVFGIK